MLSDLFANNLLIKLLRGDNSRYELITSMVGTRLGDRVLVIGGGDGRLVAAVGAGSGLTGRVCAVEADPATATAVDTEATAQGVLVEVQATPLDSAALRCGHRSTSRSSPAEDDGLAHRGARTSQRVLRPGGRCVVVAKAKASDRAVA